MDKLHIFIIAAIIYGTITMFGIWLWIIRNQKQSLPSACDCIIVLGAGLRPDGSISNQLRHRLDTGIDLYHHYQHKPIFIVSGGKGDDEPWTEAEAMSSYLQTQSIPETSIRKEEESVNTWQNLLYSRRTIAEQQIPSTHILVVTNNFHTFRTAMFIKQQKLNASTIGSPTDMYYWPKGFLREYAAIFVKTWWIFLIYLGIISFVF